MAQQLVQTPPLDPTLFTGPSRLLAGPVRTGSVTLDTKYGTNGQVEFASWLYAGTTGSVSYVKWDGTTQVLAGLLGGRWHRMGSIAINTSGTTATGLVWGS